MSLGPGGRRGRGTSKLFNPLSSLTQLFHSLHRSSGNSSSQPSPPAHVFCNNNFARMVNGATDSNGSNSFAVLLKTSLLVAVSDSGGGLTTNLKISCQALHKTTKVTNVGWLPSLSSKPWRRSSTEASLITSASLDIQACARQTPDVYCLSAIASWTVSQESSRSFTYIVLSTVSAAFGKWSLFFDLRVRMKYILPLKWWGGISKW